MRPNRGRNCERTAKGYNKSNLRLNEEKRNTASFSEQATNFCHPALRIDSLKSCYSIVSNIAFRRIASISFFFRSLSLAYLKVPMIPTDIFLYSSSTFIQVVRGTFVYLPTLRYDTIQDRYHKNNSTTAAASILSDVSTTVYTGTRHITPHCVEQLAAVKQ